MPHLVGPAIFSVLARSSSPLPFLSTSSIIQRWQLLLSSGSSDPGMLWPGLASLWLPGHGGACSPGPHSPTIVFVGAAIYPLFHLRATKIQPALSNAHQPDLHLKKYIFSLSKSPSITLTSLLQYHYMLLEFNSVCTKRDIGIFQMFLHHKYVKMFGFFFRNCSNLPNEAVNNPAAD